MFEFLAQNATDNLIVGGSGLALGSVAALLIKKGFELRVGKSNGNGAANGNGKYNAELCRRLHAEVDQDREHHRQDMQFIRAKLEELTLHIKKEG